MEASLTACRCGDLSVRGTHRFRMRVVGRGAHGVVHMFLGIVDLQPSLPSKRLLHEYRLRAVWEAS